jgi:hypothetical protein
MSLRSRTRKAKRAPRRRRARPAIPTVGFLDNFERHEQKNFAMSRAGILDEFVLLVDEGLALFHSLAERYLAAELPEHEEISVAHFIIGAGMNLQLAALAVMRGHGSDSALYTRRAVEGAAFLIEMRKDHSSFSIWLDATDDEEKAKAYRNRFKTAIVLPPKTKDPLLRPLRRVFEASSARSSHPTLTSLAGRLRPGADAKGEPAAVFTFFESTSVYDAARALIWTLEAHAHILNALSENLREAINLGATDWPTRFNAWKARIANLRAVDENFRVRYSRPSGTA